MEYQPQENAEQPTNDTSETDDSWGKEHTVLTVDNSNNAGEPAPEQGTHSVKLNDFVVNDTVSTSTSVGGLEQHEEVTIQITDVDGNVAGEQTAKVNDDQTVSVDIELAKEVLGENGEVTITVLDENKNPISEINDMDVKVKNIYDDTIDGGSGDDILKGQQGDDTIYGGEGNLSLIHI